MVNSFVSNGNNGNCSLIGLCYDYMVTYNVRVLIPIL